MWVGGGQESYFLCENTNSIWFVLRVRKLANSIISLKGHLWTFFFTKTRHNTDFKTVSKGNFSRKWSKTKRRYSVFCFLWFYLLVVRGASGKCPQNSLFRKMQREFKDSCSVETFCKKNMGATESWTQKSPTPNKLFSQFLGCTMQLFVKGFTE